MVKNKVIKTNKTMNIVFIINNNNSLPNIINKQTKLNNQIILSGMPPPT